MISAQEAQKRSENNEDMVVEILLADVEFRILEALRESHYHIVYELHSPVIYLLIEELRKKGYEVTDSPMRFNWHRLTIAWWSKS